jgi:integrase
MRAWESFLKVKGWESEYESVSCFLSHYKRKVGSLGTRDLICDVLMALCKFAGKNPDELVKLSSKEASMVLQAFIDGRADKGRSIRTINVSLAYLRMFFRVNGFKGAKELEVERYHQPSRYRKRPEYIPSSDEIQRMAYSAGSIRNKALILALYTSGLRNSTLRAVLYGDVKDELWNREIVRVPVTPEMKRVDPGACKGNIPYYSFISRETVRTLREYIAQRNELYGSIQNDEPLFASSSTNVPPQVRKHTPVKKRSLDEIVKRAAKRGEISKWKDVYPHCLRKAFESALRNAGLDPKDQEFLMGHILPGIQDPYYDSSKTEELRTKYSAVKFFKTEATDKLEMIKAFAQTLGVDKIEVKIQKLRERHSGLDEIEALGRIMRQELGIKPLETKTVRYKRKKDNVENGDCARYENKVISESELVGYLNQGWEIVKELKNTRIVMRRNLVANEPI